MTNVVQAGRQTPTREEGRAEVGQITRSLA